MRILVVEDDSALGMFLKKGLAGEGYEVMLAADGQSGLEMALLHEPELMVLDLGLPRKDGREVLAEMQGRFGRTSVLVLTGRSGVEERVACLNLGADDCLVKPFSVTELLARCRALLRRRAHGGNVTLRAGTLEMNRVERRVSHEGRPVELTVKEFALLEYLLQARGRTCSRMELLREVWQMSPEAGTNVVDVYVNYLRKKLGRVEGAERVIDTVRGEGYALALGSMSRESGLGKRPVASCVPALLDGTMRGPVTGTWGAGRAVSHA